MHCADASWCGNASFGLDSSLVSPDSPRPAAAQIGSSRWVGVSVRAADPSAATPAVVRFSGVSRSPPTGPAKPPHFVGRECQQRLNAPEPTEHDGASHRGQSRCSAPSHYRLAHTIAGQATRGRTRASATSQHSHYRRAHTIAGAGKIDTLPQRRCVRACRRGRTPRTIDLALRPSP